MGDAPEFIKIRHIGNCLKADPAYGRGVADALGIPLDKGVVTGFERFCAAPLFYQEKRTRSFSCPARYQSALTRNSGPRPSVPGSGVSPPSFATNAAETLLPFAGRGYQGLLYPAVKEHQRGQVSQSRRSGCRGARRSHPPCGYRVRVYGGRLRGGFGFSPLHRASCSGAPGLMEKRRRNGPPSHPGVHLPLYPEERHSFLHRAPRL